MKDVWEFILIFAFIVAGLIYMQKKHYEYLERKWDRHIHIREGKRSSEIQKEFEEMKKRVDALTVRSGFKL